MRSSDWSSDVCSSDLLKTRCPAACAFGFQIGITAARERNRACAGARAECDRRKKESLIGDKLLEQCRSLERTRPGAAQGKRGKRRIDQPKARRRDLIHPADVLITQRSEEHTSELQSLMRISYAVFCLQQNTTIKQKKPHPPTDTTL